MQSLFRQIRNIATVKVWWGVMAAYASYAAIFFLADVPFGMRVMEPYQKAGMILDVELFYTAAQAYERLEALGAAGRLAYAQMQWGDLLYPALFGSWLMISMAVLLKQGGSSGGRWDSLLLLPLFYMLFDYAENAMIFTLLQSYPAQLLWLASVAGLLTFAKHLAGGLSLLVLTVNLCLWWWQRLRPPQLE